MNTHNTHSGGEVKMKPATELPWETGERTPYIQQPGMFANVPIHSPWVEDAFEGDDGASQNMRYIVHAANAYPRLVEKLRALYDAAEREANAHGGDFGEVVGPSAYAAEALLRELGELP